MKIIGGLAPSASTPGITTPLSANIPEFVWASDGGGSYLIYRVVEVAENTFKRLRYCDPKNAKAGATIGEKKDETNVYGADLSVTYNEFVLPASGIKINDVPTLALKGDEKTIKVKVRGSWQKTHYAGAGETAPSATDGGYDRPKYNEGSLYFGYADYVEGAFKVADKLGFRNNGGSGDKRDLTVDKVDLAEIAKALGKVDKPTGLVGFELEIGHNMSWTSTVANQDDPFVTMKGIPGLVTLKLGEDAFAAEGLVPAFKSFFIGHNVKGDLGDAGIAKLRNKDSKEATTFTLDLSQANFQKDKTGLLTTGGDALFAKNGAAKFELSLILNSALIVGAGESNLSEWKGSGPVPIQTIGKDWFKGTTLKLSADPGSAGEYFRDVKAIGESAFEGAEVSFYFENNSNDIIPSFPNVTTIGKNAFKGATITLTSGKAGDFEPGGKLEEIGDSAFFGLKSTFLSFSELSGVKKIGKGVFAGGTEISLGDSEPSVIESGLPNGIVVPFKALATAPAGIFEGAKFVYNGSTEFGGTNLKIDASAAHPGAGIDKEAFKGFTTYVEYNDYTAWAGALSTKVEYYGFTEGGNTNNVDYIRVLDKNGRNQSVNGKFSTPYGFTEARTLSFGDAEDQGIHYYTIEGPSIEGFTTTEKTEIGEKFETGIDLTEFDLPAGLWIVKLYSLKGSEGSEKATELIEIKASELDPAQYAVEPISITWAGGKAEFEKELKEKVKDADGFTIRKISDSTVVSLPGATVGIVSENPDTTGFGIHSNLLELSITTGNLTGSIPVPVEYKKLGLTKDNVVIDPVPFSLKEKTFKAKTITVNGIKVAIDSTAAKPVVDWVEVEYPKGIPSKIGPVAVKLIGHGALTGSLDTIYQVTADWASKAVIDPEDGSYGLGETETYNGKAFGDFENLVHPLLLSEEEYEVVAIVAKDNDETLTTLAGEKKNILKEIKGTGSYDFYLIPTDKDTYGEAAAYVGNLKIDSLKLSALTKAAIVTKTGDGTFALSFNETVFAGDFDAVLDEDVFTVTLSKEQAASISGLTGLTFEIEIPTGEPEELEVKYPFAYGDNKEERLYILVGDEFDLSTIVFAVGKAKVDFREGLKYVSSKPSKLEVEGSILTALDEWNGIITVYYLDEDFEKVATTEIEVSAVYEEDLPERTGNDVIAAGSKGISYAGGALSVKGFGGTTVTVYSLNGATVSTAAVASDDAILSLGLNKGFYLIKAGSVVTKIVVQ